MRKAMKYVDKQKFQVPSQVKHFMWKEHADGLNAS